MRGKLKKCLQCAAGCGITPAGAGKTKAKPIDCIADWDHPRRCGENTVWKVKGLTLRGSPPRMRGKPTMRPTVRGYWRITPADAGKTRMKWLIVSAQQDHPRGCGENYSEESEMEKIKGSPPRMRGKLRSANCDKSIIRITPADAGKTIYHQVALCRRGDHPRGCGENARTHGGML